MPSQTSPELLDADCRNQLIRIARLAIVAGAAHRQPAPLDMLTLPEALRAHGASFVTLKRHGRLRGCIGTLEAYRPLAEDVAKNAQAAAFRDPRFPPVAVDELPDLDVQISRLTKPEEIPFANEAELIERLRPGMDGLILVEGRRRGTFLPSVWEDLSDPADFLRQLKRKAGLPGNYFSDTLQAYRYQVDVITATVP